MTWAGRRQFLIVSIIVAVFAAIIFATAFAVFYKTPTCTDGKKNDDETDIDCGGSCTYLCRVDVETPLVRFARAFSPQPGRYDVIAYVDNGNSTAGAKDVRVMVELYDKDRFLVGQKQVSIDIPPGATVPVYIPEAYRGEKEVAQTFVSFDESTLRFFVPSKKHIIPTVTNVEMVNAETPRIRATLINPTAFPLYNIRPVATVFDGAGNAIAASQTLLAQLGGQAEGSVLFSWNAPFPSTPARVEVLPLIPLPSP